MEDPLLPLPPSTTNASFSILARLAFLLFIAVASLFANHESSKSFDIVVADSAVDHSPAARSFRLSFLSNGRATRIVLDATNHINKLLHFHLHPKKPVNRVTLQLSTHNLTRPVMVDSRSGSDEFILTLNPSIFLEKDAGKRVDTAIRWGMARVLIWDGQGTAPAEVVNAIADVLSGSGWDPNGTVDPCWGDPGFLKYCERERGGFLARLNRGMREEWRPDAVADAIGSVAEEFCGAYHMSKSASVLDQLM